MTLKISDHQLDELRVGVLDEQLFQFARHDLGPQTDWMDDGALRARIAEDIEAAHALRIRSDSEVTRFVGFSLAGPRDERFYRRPEFIELLDVPDPEVTLAAFLRRLQTYFEQEEAKWLSHRQFPGQ